MKYIGSKFGRHFFQDKKNDVFSVKPYSEDVFFCCNTTNRKHDFSQEMYSESETVDHVDKYDLLSIRISFLKKNEKLEFKYIGTQADNKYFLDNFNNVYGISKSENTDIFLVGVRSSKEHKLKQLEKSIGLNLKYKLTQISHAELKTIAKPKVYHEKSGEIQNKTRRNNKKK